VGTYYIKLNLQFNTNLYSGYEAVVIVFPYHPAFVSPLKNQSVVIGNQLEYVLPQAFLSNQNDTAQI
jgi:hypothetical protein